MQRDLSAVLGHLTAVQSTEPIGDKAADANGAAIAFASSPAQEYLIMAVVGTSVFTPTASNKLEIEVEESIGGSSYTDVANANLSRVATTTAGAAATNAGCIAVIDETDRDLAIYSATYLRTSKSITHLRVVLNFTGTVTGGIPIATAIIPIHPGTAPTAVAS
jgi:hypothetical protein